MPVRRCPPARIRAPRARGSSMCRSILAATDSLLSGPSSVLSSNGSPSTTRSASRSTPSTNLDDRARAGGRDNPGRPDAAHDLPDQHWGSRIRVRISNAYGARGLTVGAARLGLRSDGAAIVDGSGRPLTFNGSPSAAIPAGALVVSDPVDLDVAPLADLAVSVYLPDEVPGDFQLTGHDPAHQTNYLSPTGDFASATDMPVQQVTEV